MEPGRPAHYTAVDPGRRSRRCSQRTGRPSTSSSTTPRELCRSLTPAYHAGRAETDPLNYVEVLREPAAIGKRFAESGGARRELLIFTKSSYAVEPGENHEGLELLARGVIARSVYERSVYDDPAVVNAVRHFVAAGEQARVVDHLPLKLVVIDERVALFTMEDPVAGSTELTIMVVEHPGFASLLKLAFERAWDAGDEFR